MKITCKVLVFDDRVPSECFSALKKICPEVIHNGVMRFYVPPDDPKIPEVISVLEAHGLKMRPNAYVPAEREFIDIIHRREFEETDFDAAKYLHVRASVSVCHRMERTQGGLLKIYMDDLNRNFRMASVSDQIVVTDSVREEFEKQGFEHLVFRRCVVG